MNLFSKMRFNDYNLILENVLENKYFSSNIKSLLLSMIYKIENSYEDYKIIKHIDKTKDEFLQEIIDIIKEYCDNVKLVEPNSQDAEIIKNNNVFSITNTKERSILAYPTELSLLYGIIDIMPKYFYIESSFLFKSAMQRLLLSGSNQNVLEVLSDFNGWSWDINLEYKNNLQANIIYQNLIIMFGQEKIDNWMRQNLSRKSILPELKKNCEGTNYFSYLCKYLYTISTKEDKQKIEEKYEFKKDSKINIFIKTQLEFTKYLLKQAIEIEDSEQLINIIYKLRYYRELFVDKKLKIKNIEKLEKNINEIYKIVITKACKNDDIKIINLDIETNYKIIKDILDTKIIDLDEIKVKLKWSLDRLVVCVYENEILEREINFNNIKRDDIGIKLNKKIKLFN